MTNDRSIVSASTAAPRLAELLRHRQDAILERWIARVLESPRYRERPPAELRQSARDVLQGVMGVLESGASVPLQGITLGLARRRHADEFPQGEVIHALLLGREVILEECRLHLEPDAVLAVTPALDVAFDRVISNFSASFCMLCRERQDQRRQHVERQLESVVDRSLDAIVFFGDDRTVRAWNPGAERLFGWSADTMVGGSLDRIVPREQLESGEIERVMRAVAESGHVRLPDTQRQRADGSRVWVDVSFTAVRDADGRTAGIWAVFRDIGERKRLEEENLQAERLALIGTMSAKLAHEVRNPLNSLVLGLDLIRDNLHTLESSGGEMVRETQELVASIDSEMQRIRSVVEHYLQFARLPTLAMKPLDLDASLRGHLELLAADLERQGIRLEARLQSGGAMIRADEAQLWQALLNLLRNSIEAMPEGGVLTVATRATATHLECEIRDTGSGMTDEVRERIFRPFFSTKRYGTGLGMPLAQQIVQEHGGTMTCESNPGEGTRFQLLLPLAMGDHAHALEMP